jgi:hypothetical protein
MMVPVLLLGGAVASILVLARWMDRHQRDIDAVHPRGFRAPLVFTSPPVG